MPYTRHPDHLRQTTTNLDDDAIFLIGLIVRWWAHAEFTVDSSIRDLLNRPDTRNLDTSLILPFPQRTKLLKSLCAEVVHDPETLSTLNNAIIRVGAYQHIRDLLTHGFIVPDSKRPETHLYASQLRWSQPIKRHQQYLSRSHLYKFEQRLARAQMHLFMLTAGCHDPYAWPASIDKSQILTDPHLTG